MTLWGLMDIIENENHFYFSINRVKRLAIERLLEIIGEAANHVSKEVIDANPDIPWSKMIGLRNKVAHDEEAMQLSVVLTPADEGGYVAYNPETETTTQGETVEEALFNLKELKKELSLGF